jgi:hypothetical protein
MPGASGSQICMGETLTIVTDETNVSSSCDESTQAQTETEAKLNGDIKSLWSAHQVIKASAKHTKQELETPPHHSRSGTALRRYARRR